MPVDAILVYGVRLYFSADGVNYTELFDMKSIGVPGMPDSPEVDVTPLADSEDFRQFRLGLAVAGEMECKQFWNKARFASLQAIYRTNAYWRMRFPDSTVVANQSKIEFRGWLKKLAPSPFDDPDAPVTSDFTVKLTGKPTFTAGT